VGKKQLQRLVSGGEMVLSCQLAVFSLRKKIFDARMGNVTCQGQKQKALVKSHKRPSFKSIR
jgi:hypothetical protein